MTGSSEVGLGTHLHTVLRLKPELPPCHCAQSAESGGENRRSQPDAPKEGGAHLQWARACPLPAHRDPTPPLQLRGIRGSVNGTFYSLGTSSFSGKVQRPRWTGGGGAHVSPLGHLPSPPLLALVSFPHLQKKAPDWARDLKFCWRTHEQK